MQNFRVGQKIAYGAISATKLRGQASAGFGIRGGRPRLLEGFAHEGCEAIWSAGKAKSPLYAYEILERVGAVAYRLALPPKLADVHSVFHVSNLRKYVHDPEHAMLYEPPELQDDLSYEEFPMAIIAWEVRKLRNREISYVKVRWSNHEDREATWELMETMRAHHPHLFGAMC